MKKISATIITYNEEDDIRDCLDSLKWVDEVIVVDSGSTDGTLDICKQYGAKVYVNEWPGHVMQKNFALSKASHEWVVSLDADERLTPPLIEEMKSVLGGNPKCDGYMMSRRAFYLGKWISHGEWCPDYKLRLYRKSMGVWAGSDPHDFVCVQGEVGKLGGEIIHYTYRNIEDQVRKLNWYTTIMAEGDVKIHRMASVPRMIISPVSRFIRGYFMKLGFLDGIPGFIIAIIVSYYVFLREAKLWEITYRTL